MLQRSGILNPNRSVNALAAAPVVALRQVRNGTSSSLWSSKAMYPCIIAEKPIEPTV